MKKERDFVKRYTRNLILIGVSGFLLFLFISYTYDQIQTAQRLRDINTKQEQVLYELVEDTKKLKSDLAQNQDLVELAKLRNQSSPAILLIDVAEKEGVGRINDDLDLDGLPDDIDLHPDGTSDHQRYELEFVYQGKEHSISVDINYDWYHYYRSKKRATSKEQYVTPHNPIIIDIAEQLRAIYIAEGYKSVSELVISVVQHIPFVEDDVSKGGPYPRFPVETLADFEGDCEDLTYVTASILLYLDIDTVLIDIPGHIVPGVACSNCDGVSFDFDGRKYYYLEPTAKGYRLGDVPPQYMQYASPTTLIRGLARP